MSARPSWEASAPCAQVDPDLWFPEANEMGNDAKRICRGCPYKAPCLLGALERGEKFGVWGGVAIAQYRRGLVVEVAA